MSPVGAAKWIGLALVGLAIAIAVAIAAANLAGRQIGITSESVSAGDSLAPSLQVPAEPRSGGGRSDRAGSEEKTPPSITAPTTVEEAVPALSEETGPPPGENGSDDHGGQGSDGDD